jgi:hypothetical protein
MLTTSLHCAPAEAGRLAPARGLLWIVVVERTIYVLCAALFWLIEFHKLYRKKQSFAINLHIFQ